MFILYTPNRLYGVLKNAIKHSYSKCHTTVNEFQTALDTANKITEKFYYNQTKLVRKIADTTDPRIKKYLTDLYDLYYYCNHLRDRAITYSRLYTYEDINADSCFKLIEAAMWLAEYNGVIETALEFIEMTKHWEEEETQSESSIGETCAESCS